MRMYINAIYFIQVGALLETNLPPVWYTLVADAPEKKRTHTLTMRKRGY